MKQAVLLVTICAFAHTSHSMNRDLFIDQQHEDSATRAFLIGFIEGAVTNGILLTNTNIITPQTFFTAQAAGLATAAMTEFVMRRAAGINYNPSYQARSLVTGHVAGLIFVFAPIIPT